MDEEGRKDPRVRVRRQSSERGFVPALFRPPHEPRVSTIVHCCSCRPSTALSVTSKRTSRHRDNTRSKLAIAYPTCGSRQQTCPDAASLQPSFFTTSHSTPVLFRTSECGTLDASSRVLDVPLPLDGILPRHSKHARTTIWYQVSSIVWYLFQSYNVYFCRH